MKKLLALLLFAGIPASYAGGISHSISSSVQLEAVSAGSIAEKFPVPTVSQVAV